MISEPKRRQALTLIEQAHQAGAALAPACKAMGISVRTFQRWSRPNASLCDGRLFAKRPSPANRLSDAERAEILAICNQPEYRSMSPCQIVPKLADEGRFVASESSFYRVLRSAGQLAHRGRSKEPRKTVPPKSHRATAPNQVWSWDITFLRSCIAGQFFRLYLILDVYSRKIVGWEVHEQERAEHSAALISKACLAQGVKSGQLVLHSDNGSPMKGATMLSTLQRLGVVPSFSRPSVSDDNAYSESLFRTLKYTPTYPSKPFPSIADARQWVHEFVTWYNQSHRHSGLKFVTPDQRHKGEDTTVLNQRNAVYEEAKACHPERWTGQTRNWKPIKEVWLNPQKSNSGTKPIIENAA